MDTSANTMQQAPITTQGTEQRLCGEGSSEHSLSPQIPVDTADTTVHQAPITIQGTEHRLFGEGSSEHSLSPQFSMNTTDNTAQKAPITTQGTEHRLSREGSSEHYLSPQFRMETVDNTVQKAPITTQGTEQRLSGEGSSGHYLSPQFPMDTADNIVQQAPITTQVTKQRLSGEGSSKQGEAGLQEGGEKPMMPTYGAETEGAAPAATPLNLSAKEWEPLSEKAPEEDRCLFLTFSNGYPLTEYQIVDCFTRTYGACIEKVYVHWPEPPKHIAPLFGKVVFSTSVIPAMIMGGETQVKFDIDGRPLWCKKFDPKK